MVDASFWPWWVGGAAMALFVIAFPLVTGRLLGVSSIYSKGLELLGIQRPAPATRTVATVDELERALLAETEAEFGPLPGEPGLPADELSCALPDALAPGSGGRWLLLVGLVLGGAIAHVTTGDTLQVASLGRLFDQRFHAVGMGTAVAVLLASGILIGFGTRMAGGCTSGHGISGIARGEPGSLVSTLTFWSVGVATTWLIFWLLR